MEAQPTMTTSESISNIAAALAKAQGAFKPIVKNRTVEVQPKKRDDGSWPPKYTFNYATLDSVLDATREALSANGICHTAMIANGHIVVKLYHASGEWFAASLPVPSAATGWQAFGSAITYARRYLLTPLLGVASEEDDDANVADGNELQPGPDPMQPLWDAIDKTPMAKMKPQEVRTWCEMVLGRPIPQPSAMSAKDLPVLLAALAKDTAKPEVSKESIELEKLALAKELNTALNELAPWGSAIEGKSSKDAAAIKQTAKLQWANGMRPGAKAVYAFGELTVDEMRSLIAKAKAGEVPSEDMPEWMNEQMP
ncbi:MAG TPA: ERF family protein [Polyangiaceae bacterium]